MSLSIDCKGNVGGKHPSGGVSVISAKLDSQSLSFSVEC